MPDGSDTPNKNFHFKLSRNKWIQLTRNWVFVLLLISAHSKIKSIMETAYQIVQNILNSMIQINSIVKSATKWKFTLNSIADCLHRNIQRSDHSEKHNFLANFCGKKTRNHLYSKKALIMIWLKIELFSTNQISTMITL